MTTLGDATSATAERDQGLLEDVPALDRWVAAGLGDRGERLRLRGRYLASGFRAQPLPAHRHPVEGPIPGRIGICCSGGGIRSAAFNLGALQKLQEAGRLQQTEYLAAVSGGSYIAAAFAMVAKTTADGSSDDSDPELIEREGPFAHGSPEEQYLRNRSDYLAPDGMAKIYLGYRVLLGLILNLFFLALPFFGATMLLGVLLYRHSFSALVTCAPGAAGNCTPAGSFDSRSVHLPLAYWAIPAGIAVVSVVLGALVMVLPPTKGWVRRDGLIRAMQIWSTRLLVGAALLALLTVALPELVALLHVHGKGSGASSGTSSTKAIGVAGGGVAGLLAGVVAVLRELFTEANKAAGVFAKLSAQVRRLIAYAAAAILGPLLLYAVVVFSMSFTLANAGSASSRGWLLWVGGLGALVLFGALYWMIDITALSLHPFYRRRLCTAFALKRIKPKPPLSDAKHAIEKQAELKAEADDLKHKAKEDKKDKKKLATDERSQAPSETTAGVADAQQTDSYAARAGAARERANAVRAADDQQLKRGVAMERNYDNLVRLSKTGLDPSKWPTLIVCAAANISEPGATPPGRRVTSFTFSCSTVGGPLVGATTTQRFEEVFKDRGGRKRDLSLPAAVAMSGAAIAPSMGKMTPRALTFLLALANIRLGVWVPNPRWVAGPRRSWRRPSPYYLIKELIGRNRVNSHYLFVTDGGHYENLGLVELLRRGCTKIYCFDASGGEGFEALGDAVALARSELGVEIDIRPDPLKPGSAELEAESACCGKDSTPKAESAGCAKDAAPQAAAEGGVTDEALAAKIAVSAKFVYSDGTEGELVYARNVMSPGAPWDVRAHHISDPSFPHNSTVDQLYTDQKFESYRALGVQAGTHALTLMGSSEQPATS